MGKGRHREKNQGKSGAHNFSTEPETQVN